MFSALLAVIGVSAIALLLHRLVTKKLNAALQKQLESTYAAEKQTHLKEVEFLSKQNALTSAHANEITSVKESAFKDGRKQGRCEQELECERQLVDQLKEISTRLEVERNTAIAEACAKQRAESELQQKLFSVNISPYVQLLTDKGLIFNSYEVKAGYQYQLLVSGIPAFQPHVIVERHEKVKQIDQAVKNTMLSLAKTCAEAALQTYLGGVSAQFAKLAPEIIEAIDK